MPGARDHGAARAQVDLDVAAGGEGAGVDVGHQPVAAGDDGDSVVAFSGVRTQRVAQLPHRAGGVHVVALHVTDHEAHAFGGDPDDSYQSPPTSMPSVAGR